jgi:hypothetical protein
MGLLGIRRLVVASAPAAIIVKAAQRLGRRAEKHLGRH